MNKSACVIVTYKKPELLSRCISAVLNQTVLPEYLVIVDNNSNDNTYDICLKALSIDVDSSEDLKRGNLLAGSRKGVETYYFNKNINDGGSGGFSDGIEIVLDRTHSDMIWLMDDDGVPHKDCLANLVKVAEQNIVYNPLVVDINDTEKCSFLINEHGKQLEVQEALKNSKSIEINPFNGTYFSVSVIKRFGNVKNDMFIWGDEMEFIFRMRANNIPLVTVTEARHYHPQNKKSEVIRLPFNVSIRNINNEYFEYVYYRNRIWNDFTYRRLLNRRVHLVRSIIDASLNGLYHFTRGRFKRALSILRSIIHGLSNNFSVKYQNFLLGGKN